ncbi:MAG: epoxyqueuosine reductase [Bacillota bacterium]|nr:epoxyqueuosine reductase [Bacillota bacterium]
MERKKANKNIIINEIKSFIAEENAKSGLWQEPIVGFAGVGSEYIRRLREVVHPEHQMPEEVLANAKVVIAYFVPFDEKVADSNIGAPGSTAPSGTTSGDLASPQWAESYEVTNAMFGRLNKRIIEKIKSLGFDAATAPEAEVFYRDEVMSHWSFRHLAYAAGLGTFGLNNMLITEKGCSGRYNTIVTDMDVEPDEPLTEEACLYKRDGSCGICMIKCPAGAITENGFDRHKCYEQCLKNAEIYTGFGSSYTGGADNSEAADIGSEVCGKCIAGMPCTHKRP